MLKEIRCFSVKGKNPIFMWCYNNTVCLAFLSLFITQQSPHKTLWSLCASVPCKSKCKFTINHILHSLPLGCWQLLQWGTCRERVIPWACGSEDGAKETQWQMGAAAASPFCFSGKSHSCHFSHYTPPGAAIFYHWASPGESSGGDRHNFHLPYWVERCCYFVLTHR